MWVIDELAFVRYELEKYKCIRRPPLRKTQYYTVIIVHLLCQTIEYTRLPDYWQHWQIRRVRINRHDVLA